MTILLTPAGDGLKNPVQRRLDIAVLLEDMNLALGRETLGYGDCEMESF